MGKEGLGISFSGQVQASGPAPAVVPAHQQGKGTVLTVAVALREKICARSQLLGWGAEAWFLGPRPLQHTSCICFLGPSQASHAIGPLKVPAWPQGPSQPLTFSGPSLSLLVL